MQLRKTTNEFGFVIIHPNHPHRRKILGPNQELLTLSRVKLHGSRDSVNDSPVFFNPIFSDDTDPNEKTELKKVLSSRKQPPMLTAGYSVDQLRPL